jgi:hypothetical protein
MKHFPRYLPKSLTDVSPGTFVAFHANEKNGFGLVVERQKILVLSGDLSDTRRKYFISEGDLLLRPVIPVENATVVLPNLGQVALDFTRERPDTGAACLVDSKIKIVAYSVNSDNFIFDIEDGAGQTIEEDEMHKIPCFKSWSIAAPDINGKMVTICDVKVQ